MLVVCLVGYAASAQITLDVHSPSTLAESHTISNAEFGAGLDETGITAEVVYLGDDLACDSVPQDLTGKIVMVARGTCSFNLKASNVEKSGAAAFIQLLYTTDKYQRGLSSDPTVDSVHIPCASMIFEQFGGIIDALENGETVTATLRMNNQFDNLGEPIWVEEFDGGLGDWTSVNNTNPSEDTLVKWEWSPRGQTNYGYGYNFGTDGWLIFALNSPTAYNGVAAFDAIGLRAYVDTLSPDGTYNVSLVSPTIDATGYENFFLTFYTWNQGLNAESSLFPQTYFEYSIDDGLTWSEAIEVPSENLLTSTSISQVYTETHSYLLSDINQTEFLKLRFTYAGDAYYWSLDDISLFEVPANNPKMEDGFYPALSYATPSAHLPYDTFGLIAMVRNEGSSANDFITSVTITDEAGNVVDEFSDVRNIAATERDTITLTSLSAQYPEGRYTITYSVKLDSIEDDIPGDTEVSFDFVVSDDVFAQELSEDSEIVRTFGDEVFGWFYGKFFLTGNPDDSDELYFNGSQAAFGFNPNVTDSVFRTGDAINAYLLKWTDGDDGFPSVQDVQQIASPPNDFTNANLTIIAQASIDLANPDYGFSPNSVLDLTLDKEGLWFDENFNPIGVNELALEPGSFYAVAFEMNERLGISWVRPNRPNSMTELVYATDANGSLRYYNRISASVEPVVRAIVGSRESATNEPSLPQQFVKVYPTLTSSVVNVEMNFDKPLETSVNVFDNNGRVILSNKMGEVQSATHTFRMDNDPSGMYHIKVVTPEGISTQSIILSK